MPAADREAAAVWDAEREAAADWRGCAAPVLVVAAFTGAATVTADRVVTALAGALVLRALEEGSLFLLAGLDGFVAAALA